MKKIRSVWEEFKLLERSVPAFVLALFITSVVVMNLMANKSIDTPFGWLVVDGGIFFSWISFLTMDIVTRRFGPRAANMLMVLALFTNLIMSFIFFGVGAASGAWGESFVDVGGDIINTALDNTVRGSWYVLLGSSIAFCVSAVVNNYLNAWIGKWTKDKKGFGYYALRSYASTLIGQFVDNLLFGFIVSVQFFGWTVAQAIFCAITGAVLELLCEVIFSPIGYRICVSWERDGVGDGYLALVQRHKTEVA